MTFVDKDGEEKHIKVPIGMSMLEAAHENDIELEGKFLDATIIISLHLTGSLFFIQRVTCPSRDLLKLQIFSIVLDYSRELSWNAIFSHNCKGSFC